MIFINEHPEVKMSIKRALLINLIVVLAIFLGFNLAFSQAKGAKIISFNGVIDAVPKSLKFIMVNEERVNITSDTKIVDAYGSTLKVTDLKVKLHVEIEAVTNQKTLYAKKIVVKPSKKRL